MFDEPPQVIVEAPAVEASRTDEIGPDENGPDEIGQLPTEIRADGSLVIDLLPLAPPPTECVAEEPDPFNSEIIVCADRRPSPRLGANYVPTADEVIEGSAVPRARLRLSDKAAIELNAANNAVGGFNANGAEARVRIEF